MNGRANGSSPFGAGGRGRFTVLGQLARWIYPRAGMLMKIMFLTNSTRPNVNIRADSLSPFKAGGRGAVYRP